MILFVQSKPFRFKLLKQVLVRETLCYVNAGRTYKWNKANFQKKKKDIQVEYIYIYIYSSASDISKKFIMSYV